MNFLNNKTVALLTAAVMAASVPVSAAVVDNADGKGVTVSGQTDEPNSTIAIEVYKKGKTAKDLKDLTEAEKLEILVSYDGGVTDKDGGYSFTFDIPQGSGEYVAYAATEKTTLDAEEFVFVSNEDFENTVDDVKAAASTSDVETLIKNNTYELGLTEEQIKDVSTSGLAKVIYNSKNDLDKANRTETHELVQQALLVQKLNDGKVSNIYNEDVKNTMFDDSDIKDFYNRDYVTAKLEADFTNRMSNRGFESIEEYKDALAEAFVLATIRYPNGNGNVEDIVTAFESKIGVNASALSSNVWSGLAGENIASYAALANKIDSLDGGSSTGGGNGGGGGGGGGSYSKLPNAGISGIEKEDPETIPTEIYTDLDGYDWAKTAIVTLSEKKILSGDGNGGFRPGDNITREEFCKLVVAAFELSTDDAKNDFNDVDDNEWYAEYVKIAAANGVVNGIGNGSFGIGQNITREDMAVMLYRAYTLSLKLDTDAKKVKFGDDASIADYAKDAVYALKAKSVINGVDGTNFAPKNLAQRAEAAKMIYALIQD